MYQGKHVFHPYGRKPMTVSAPLPTRANVAQDLANLSEDQFTAATLFLQAIVEAAQAGNLDAVDIDEFRESLNLRRLLNPILNPTITVLLGVVLPAQDKPLPDRITVGGYHWHDDNITAANFPVTRDAGPQPLFLVHFGVYVSSEEVEEWSKANGYEAANNDDLLAVGSSEQHKDLQRDFPIVQLGSSKVLLGSRRVSCLCGDCWMRLLDLDCYDGGWGYGFRFLLRKVS